MKRDMRFNQDSRHFWSRSGTLRKMLYESPKHKIKILVLSNPLHTNFYRKATLFPQMYSHDFTVLLPSYSRHIKVTQCTFFYAIVELIRSFLMWCSLIRWNWIYYITKKKKNNFSNLFVKKFFFLYSLPLKYRQTFHILNFFPFYLDFIIMIPQI